MNAPVRPVAQKKPFSWTYSKLKSFESCQLRHEQVDLKKAFVDDKGEMLAWGERVHKSLEAALIRNAPLPIEMQRYQSWVDLVKRYAALPGAKLHVEFSLALDNQLRPCGVWDKVKWWGGKADVIVLMGTTALALDWKTGKVLVDSPQLGLMAQGIMSFFPDVQKVQTAFVWLAEDSQSPELYTRDGMAPLWSNLKPRIAAMENAYLTGVYHEMPSGLCKRYCPVETCQYHGIGSH